MFKTFQDTPNQASRMARAKLEDGFAAIIQGCRETDFARLYDAVDELRRVDPIVYRSLRSHHLMREIFNIIDSEDAYRTHPPLPQLGEIV